MAQQTGLEVQPTPGTLRVIQDKYRQKQHFSEAGVPLPEYREIKCAKCAAGAGAAFGYPYRLKRKPCVAGWGGSGGGGGGGVERAVQDGAQPPLASGGASAAAAP